MALFFIIKSYPQKQNPLHTLMYKGFSVWAVLGSNQWPLRCQGRKVYFY